MLNNMRKHPLEKIGKYNVIGFRDYQTGIIKNILTGEEAKTKLPNSNVLYYELENDAWCCVRPSGTEPKVKFYLGVKADSLDEAEKELEKMKETII